MAIRKLPMSSHVEVDLGEDVETAGFDWAGKTRAEALENAKWDYGPPVAGIMLGCYQGVWYASDGINAESGDPYTCEEVVVLSSAGWDSFEVLTEAIA